MSTDVFLASTFDFLPPMSMDDVSKAALLVSGFRAFTGAAGVLLPVLLVNNVMEEMARREEKKEQKEEKREEKEELVRLAEREADRAERRAERQADRFLIFVVCVAAALLAAYLKN